MASTLAASVATPTVAAVAARHRAPSHRLWSDVGKCPVPVQVQWGARDRYLEEIAIPPADVAPLANRQIVRHPDATHWVQWDEPDAVSEALIEFLNEK